MRAKPHSPGILRRTWALLRPEERREARRAVACVLGSALLGFASLAALFPVLYLLLDKEPAQRTVLLFCALALAVALLKFGLGAFLDRYKERFLLRLYRRLSFSLYKAYFQKGLLFVRQQGVTHLGLDINGLCWSFSQGVLAALLTVAGEALLLLLVLAAIVFYNPLTACILALAFFPLSLAYSLGVRPKAGALGQHEREVQGRQSRLVHDTFAGYTQLQTSRAFDAYAQAFAAGTEDLARTREALHRLHRLPLFFCELAVVLGFTLITFMGGAHIRLLVGLFAVAAVRLLPALRSLLAGWTALQKAGHCLSVLEEGLRLPPALPEEPAPFTRSLCLTDLSYAYPGGPQVFTDLNLRLRQGEYLGIQGPSGVGKSTLFHLLLGFLPPDSGQITIDGLPLTPARQQAWLSQVGYVPQEPFLFATTLAHNISLGDPAASPERIRELLSQVHLLSWADALPQGIHTPVTERGLNLSGGQRQRIGLARALYRPIRLLLLDEATASLDAAHEEAVLQTLDLLRRRRRDLTLLFIAHRESSLSHCERIIQL